MACCLQLGHSSAGRSELSSQNQSLAIDPPDFGESGVVVMTTPLTQHKSFGLLESRSDARSDSTFDNHCRSPATIPVNVGELSRPKRAVDSFGKSRPDESEFLLQP